MKRHLLCLLVLTNATTFAADTGDGKYELKRFRFQGHGKYERLVLEFARKEKGKHPTLSVTTTGEEGQLEVRNVTLVGAIPESAINDGFSGKSHYLGNISINTDASVHGFMLKAALKPEGGRIEGLWLQDPPRLVVDAYAKGAPAAKRSQVASLDKAKGPNGGYFCFPANAQVGLSVIFQPKARRQTSDQVRIDLEANPPGQAPDGSADAIVCYPSGSQVVPSIAFHEGVEVQRPGEERSSFSWNPVTPPTSKSLPVAPNSPPSAHSVAAEAPKTEGANSEHVAEASIEKPAEKPVSEVRTPASTGAKEPGGATPMTKPAANPQQLLPPLK